MPRLRISEYYYGKRYVVVVKKCCGTETFFSTTTYAAIRNIIMESGIKGVKLCKACIKRLSFGFVCSF